MKTTATYKTSRSVLLLPVRLFVVFLAFRHAATMGHLAESCSLEEGIPPRAVRRSAAAASLSRLIYQIGDGLDMNDKDTAFLESHGFYDATHYVDEIDSVLVARYEDDYCLAAFRGTTSNLLDALSNLNVDHIEYNSTRDGYSNNPTTTTNPTCYLHEGYHNAYADFQYKTDIGEYLETCTFECPTCEVILTGHSQGGAVAEIAALFLKEGVSGNGNITESPPPHVITFGAPQSIGTGCLEFFSEEERCGWYHYIMATSTPFGRSIVYDPVPINYANIFVNGRYSKPGHSIIVSSRDVTSSYYSGSDGNYTINIKTLPTDLTGAAHRKQLYMDVLNELSDNYASGSTPLPTNGFSLGSLCDKDQDLCGEGLECKTAGILGGQKTCYAMASNTQISERPVAEATKGEDGYVIDIREFEERLVPIGIAGFTISGLLILMLAGYLIILYRRRNESEKDVAGNPETEPAATTTTGTTAENNDSNDANDNNNGSKDAETPMVATTTPVESTAMTKDNSLPVIAFA